MPIRVQVVGHGIVEFPDGMSQDEIAKALSSLSTPQGPSPVTLASLGADKRPLTDADGRVDPALKALSPQAQDAFRDAKETAANVGIGAGAMAAGGVGAAAEPEVLTGLTKGLGQTGLGYGAYKAMTALGVPSEMAGAISGIVSGGGIKSTMQNAIKARGVRMANVDMTVPPTAEPFGPKEAPDFLRLDVGPTRQPFGPSIGRPPTKFVGAKVMSPSGAANVEATAPIMPDVETLKATMASPTAADTPRDYHTGETGATREDLAKGTYNPSAVRAKEAHTAINQEQAIYRNFADQARQALDADPSIRDLLLARLMGGGS